MKKNSAAKKILTRIFRKKKEKSAEAPASRTPSPAPATPATPPTRIPESGPAPKGKVKSILIAQPKPETDKHPYTDLSYKYQVKIDFRPFIILEPISAKEFRKYKVNPTEYASVIFTSRNAIDQYFKLLEELRCKVSEETRYYCTTEAIALYLQKYIMFRKRKVFYGDGTQQGMLDEILRHKDDGKYLMPCADNHKNEVAEWMKKNKLQFAEAVIFKTVPALLNEKEVLGFDLIAFFSASAVQAFRQNFPALEQKKLRIAVFGPLTQQAAKEAGLRVDVAAPAPEMPSMAMAIDKYLAGTNA